MGVESAVVKFEVVMNAELGPIGEEKLAVVERSSDGGINASDRILEDPQAVAKAAKAEGAEKQDGDDPDRGGNRGSWRRGLRLHHFPEGRADVSAQRRVTTISSSRSSTPFKSPEEVRLLARPGTLDQSGERA